MGKRTKGQRLKDSERIADLYRQGYTIRQIAKTLNSENQEEDPSYSISFQTAFNDVKKIIKEWEENRLSFIDNRITVELEKINRLERQYNTAWEQSQRDEQKRRIKSKGGSGENAEEEIQERQLEVKETPGDKRWLEGIQWCIEMRLKLLGIERKEGSGNAPDETIEIGGTIFHI